MCYVYCVGLIPDTLSSWMDYYKTALEKKVISEEGFILDAEKLIFCLSGRKVSVTKKAITDIKDIKQMCPVMYSMDGGKSGHFVVVENGQIVFNPLEVSQNVNKGKPISARIIRMV